MGPPCPQDAEQRLLYVAAFAVGAYPSVERTYKPFNPLLGETFEFRKGGMHYVAEQARRQAAGFRKTAGGEAGCIFPSPTPPPALRRPGTALCSPVRPRLSAACPDPPAAARR